MSKAPPQGLAPRSFAAELAKNPIQEKRRWFIGVDPDGHTTGVAWLHASWTTPMTGPVSIKEVYADLVSIPQSLRGLVAVDSMVGALSEFLLNVRALVDRDATLVAEAQQVYAREEMPRAEIIAKANDLLKLALTTGASLALAERFGWSYTAELPKDWKQQKDKGSHHIQIAHRLNKSNTPVTIGGKYTVANRPAKFGHAMDAIGLALWAADREAAGTLAAHHPTR